MRTHRAILSAAFCLALVLNGCTTTPKESPKPQSVATQPAAVSGQPKAPVAPAAPRDLVIDIVKPGDGVPAAKGDRVRVHYIGWTGDFRDEKFDSSRDRRQPFEFQLGGGQVIKGWDRGVVGMLPGEVRRLTIPPELGYGARGAGDSIPPNATLYFEIEYLGLAGSR